MLRIAELSLGPIESLALRLPNLGSASQATDPTFAGPVTVTCLYPEFRDTFVASDSLLQADGPLRVHAISYEKLSHNVPKTLE